MTLRFLTRFSFCCIFALGSAIAAEPTLTEVLKSTPKTANAVMHLDLVSLRKLTFGTPMEMDLPSRLDRIRIAADLDLGRLQPNWEIGYGTMKQLPGSDVIADAMGGYVEKVGDRDVVWTPNQMYLVPLGDTILSVVRPSDRKFLTQWLRKDRNSTYDDVLLSASATPTDNLSVMIAVDVADVISSASILVHLADFQSLKGQDLKVAAKEISELLSVKLEVAQDSLSKSRVTLRFSNQPTVLSSVAKDFFGELLQRRGSSLGDLAAWNVKMDTASKSIVFNGPIVPATLDDVLGLFTVQRQTATIEHHAQQPKDSTQAASPSSIAENTKEYFKKVINIAHRVRDYSASNTGERAQWNGNMASRIDEFPTLNIDPEMVEFGAEVAKSLRNNMMSMQLTNIAVGAQAVANNAGAGGFSTATGFGTRAGMASGFASNYGYGSGGGFSDPNSISSYYMAAQSQGNSSFKQLMGQIDQAIADMRRRMTEKYGIQF